jgi:hypothetical protein
MAQGVLRNAPVICVLLCQPLLDQRGLYVHGRLLEELPEAVLEPCGPVPVLWTLPVWVWGGDGHVANLHPSRRHDIDTTTDNQGA